MCVIIVCTVGYDDIVRSAEEFLEDPGPFVTCQLCPILNRTRRQREILPAGLGIGPSRDIRSYPYFHLH